MLKSQQIDTVMRLIVLYAPARPETSSTYMVPATKRAITFCQYRQDSENHER